MPEIDLVALPPEDAIAYFAAKGKRLDPSFHWTDAWQEDHAAMFTVAKSAGFDVLQDIHDATLAAIRDGTTWQDFKARLVPILQAKGWWGRQTVTDPLTGEAVSAQLGSTRRLRTIFDVNMRMSHAAGKWAQAQRAREARPYLRYSAILDGRTRPLHRAWHGTVLPMDHAWWKTHYPPNGWHCRCTVQQLSPDDLDRNNFAVSPDPEIVTRAWENPRTGEVVEVPEGIDPGFAYNPGEAAITAHAAQAAAQKLPGMTPTLAAQAASARFLLPGLRQGTAQWVDAIAARLEKVHALKAADQPTQGVRLALGETRIVGAFSDATLAGLARHGVEPASGAIRLTDQIVIHMLRDAKAARGGALAEADIRRIPDILAAPQAVLFDTADPALLYVFELIGDEAHLGKFVVRVDFHAHVRDKDVRAKDGARRAVVVNDVRSGGAVRPNDLYALKPDGAGRYDLLEGRL